MLHTGENVVNGVPVEVVRKNIRRINVSVSPYGRVQVSVPRRWATLSEAEAFLHEKWKWVVKTRADAMSRPAPARTPPSREALERLRTTIAELNALWTAKLGEADVKWKLRPMKTLWGSCHWRKRVVTYNTDLATVPRELVEYVVVHELTHLRAHDHGPDFQKLMSERLSDWRNLRRRLNKREYDVPAPSPGASLPEAVPPRKDADDSRTPAYYQAEFPLFF